MGKLVAKAGALTVTEIARLEDLRRELQRAAGRSPLRWNADPDEVQRSVAQLVLTLVEFIRKLLERQAIRRMEGGTLTDQQTEDIGARRLQTIMEKLLEDISFEGPDLEPKQQRIDAGYVQRMLSETVKDQDLSRYIL